LKRQLYGGPDGNDPENQMSASDKAIYLDLPQYLATPFYDWWPFLKLPKIERFSAQKLKEKLLLEWQVHHQLKMEIDWLETKATPGEGVEMLGGVVR